MSDKQTRTNDYVAHQQHLARRATPVPSGKRYSRKRKHRSRESE